MAHPFEARRNREEEATQLLQEVWDSDRDSDGDLCIYLDEAGNSDLLNRIEAFLTRLQHDRTKGAKP